MKRKTSGFTLIELISIVVVISTLALIAIPNYAKSKNRNIQKEGVLNVKLIAAAERIFRDGHDSYTACSCSSASDCSNGTNGCNYLLNLNLNTQNWTYNVALNSDVPTITARVIKPYVIPLYCVYTLIVDDSDAEPSPNSGCI